MVDIPFYFIFLIVVLVWFFARFVIIVKNKTFNIFRELYFSAFIVYFLMVISVTFFPMIIFFGDQSFKSLNLIPMTETIDMFNRNLESALFNVVGNILMFMPLGFSIPVMYKKGENLGKVILYGLCGSLLIESLQYFMSIRITDIDDVIFNTIGAASGYAVFKFTKAIMKKVKLTSLVQKLQYQGNQSVILTALKPLSIIVILSFTVVFGAIYNVTYSSELTDKELAIMCLGLQDGKFILSKNHDGRRYILTSGKYDNYELLEVETFEKVFRTRYFALSSDSIKIENNESSYNLEIEYKGSTDSYVSYIYGNSAEVSKISIKYKDKEYSEDISASPYFLVVYPYETDDYMDMAENLDIRFYDGGGKDITSLFRKQ